MESAYHVMSSDRLVARTPSHREVMDVIRARHEVRTPSAAHQPAAGPRRQMSQLLDVPDPRGAVLIGGTGSVIRTFSRLPAPQRGSAFALEPETAEPGGPVRSANGDNGAGAAEPRVTTEELTILTLLADGLTLDSVAIRVSVSPRTLSRRLRCVCDRLGVSHPIQAIVWAAHQGLI
jgi:DNA-binding CsgD family transcriptional regulator